jgi:adenine-specific DNA-methyltransferase
MEQSTQVTDTYNLSLNYIGSKHSLASTLYEKMHPYLIQNNVETIADLFSGSGAMSRFLFEKYHIYLNDIMYYSNIITQAQLIHCPNLQKWIDLLNQCSPIEGKITKFYSPVGDRMFFTKETAMKIDGMRTLLEEWNVKDEIHSDEYIKLLGTIIHFADKHANTASVYGAFLKKFKDSAKREFKISNLFDYKKSPKQYFATQSDVLDVNFEWVQSKMERSIDAVYLDPPYNQRSYSKNYSPLETLAKYDDPIIKGITGLREDSGDFSGLFCKKTQAKKAFQDLAKKLDGIPLIFMSYNNEGLLTENQIKGIFEDRGRSVVCEKIEYSRFSSKKNQNREVEEYLFIIQ